MKLEANKAVDKKAGAQGRGETVLHRGEVRICSRSGGYDARVQYKRSNRKHHVKVEERRNLFAT